MIAQTPKSPYYAVIFTSVRTEGDHGYAEMAARMVELASQQDGFLGVESVMNEIGITVSYWRENFDHTIAREKGRKEWYQTFKVRIAKVESNYVFESK